MLHLIEPIIIDPVFDADDFVKIQKELLAAPKDDAHFDSDFGRYSFSENELPILGDCASSLLEVAREVFGSSTLLPSYALFAHYQGPKANLFKHIDDNACTYTIDMCVYQKKEWDLWVEDQPYTLYPNQALAYHGNDQMHWRESFPEPENNFVAMVFFHFVEPDHWFFTKGPEYLQEIIRINNSKA